MTEGHRTSQHVPAFRHDDQRSGDDGDRAEEWIRFFGRVAGWSGGAYLLLVCIWGAVITATGKSILPLWLLLALGGILFVIALFSSFIAGVGRIYRPTGVSAYMYKNPSVYVIGTVLGLVGFAMFSGHSFQSVFVDFSISKMLALESARPGERHPSYYLISYIALGWLGTGVLFYVLSKLSGGEEETKS